MIIYWSEFTWEAFATLVTGASAVGGAVWVGIRQSGISHRQTQILDRQVRLEELSLRADLFERRFVVYEATRKFLAEIVAHADKPTPEVEREFVIALNESVFLFNGDVHIRIRGIWKTACEFFAGHTVLEAANRRGATNPQDLLDREHKQLLELSDKLLNLAAEFGDELKLS